MKLIDRSNLNYKTHKYMEFESAGGMTKVNIGMKEVNHDFLDFEVGENTFKLEVRHTYSTTLIGFDFKMGDGWMLNICEHIYLNTNSNLGDKSISVGDYVYVDGNSNVYIFKSYNGNYYCDTKGLGLTLIKETGGYLIKDNKGNRLEFDIFGRLIKQVRKEKKEIVKEIIYNQEGLPEKYYDTRSIGEHERYIGFSYKDGLLDKMYLMANGEERESIYY